MKPKTVLVFSRGRGRGHAILDIALIKEVAAVHSGAKYIFVSYATGAATFRLQGEIVIDLGLPESNGFIDSLVKMHALILELKPSLVVCHEECAAVVAAKICSVPSIFLSAWLPPERSIGFETLSSCSAIILLSEPGLFKIPAEFSGRTHYVAPLVRRLTCSSAERDEIRVKLGLSFKTFFVLVIPGGWARERIAPISHIVLPAFASLKGHPKRLVWLAGADRELLATGVDKKKNNIEILDYLPNIDHLIVASDVVVTKGTWGTSVEVASVNVPSISLSPKLNGMDDYLIDKIRSNVALDARATTAEMLAFYFNRIRASDIYASKPAVFSNSKISASEALLHELERHFTGRGN